MRKEPELVAHVHLPQAHPHRRAALRVPRVREAVPGAQRPAAALNGNTFEATAVYLLGLPQEFRQFSELETAYAHPHRRETLRVLALRQTVHAERVSTRTFKNPYRNLSSQLRGLRREVQVAV